MNEQENDVRTALIQQFRQAVGGTEEDGWYGGLLHHVQRTTAAHASQTTHPGSSSAAGQLGHVVYWLRIGQQRLAGGTAAGDQKTSFQHSTVNDQTWQRLQHELSEQAARFEAAIGNVPHWNHDTLMIVLNQITHVAYHAGAVIQILKATQ